MRYQYKKKRPTEVGRQAKDTIFSAVKTTTKLNREEINVK